MLNSSDYKSLILTSFETENRFLATAAIETIAKHIRDDCKKAMYINSGMPCTDQFILSGIIDYLPGGNKNRTDKEDILIQEILLRLEMPYDSQYIYMHRDHLWRAIAALIKNCGKQ